jgi:hypothetical protein
MIGYGMAAKTITRKPLLSLARIQDHSYDDPLKLFYGGIKAQDTKDAYRKTLSDFLSLVEEFSGTFDQKAVQFVTYARKDPDKAKQLLKTYATLLKERTEKPKTDPDYINPNTVPNKFKGIKKFLKMNEVPIEWANIEAIFPENNNVKQTRGYTTEEIRQILDYSTDVTTKFLILAESSSGIRVGAWENQVWGNIRPIYEIGTGIYTHDVTKTNNNSRTVCASMVVYNGTSSKYLGLISIEAWDTLQTMKKQWTRNFGRTPKPEDQLILNRSKQPFTRNGVRNKLNKVIWRSGVQKSMKKEERNYEVPLTHGMRKRWNKIMSEQKINQDSQANLIRKERLFGHKTGVTKLDNSYFFSEIEEAIPQYLQAMPELMISDEYRAKKELQFVQEENKQLQQTIKEKDNALSMLEELKMKFERFEKYQGKCTSETSQTS